MHDNSRVPGIRIGDAERDTAATELGEHYAAGRLTLDELHERLGSVLSARTRGDLTHVLADLPTIRRPAPPATATPPRSQEQEQEPADHVGRVAAVALLLLAILIWLFTVAMFTRHGGYYYYPHYPHQPSPWGN